jgi:transposase
MPRVPLYKREIAVLYLSDGYTASEIALLLKISRGAVRNILEKHMQGFHIADKPRSGRPQLLSERAERSIVIASKKHPFKSAREIRDAVGLQSTISVSTAKRVLRRNNLFGRISAPKPSLTPIQKKKRLRWCQQHLNSDASFWSRVIFSDESPFELKPQNKKIVRRPKGKRLHSKYISGTSKFSPKIMVWGAIRSDGTRVLERCLGNVNAMEYQRILNVALPSIYTRHHLLQQDGASCHTSHSTTAYLQRKKVKVLENWPPQSPDINVIENLWQQLKAKVYTRTYKTLDELWESVSDEWDRLPADCITKLFHSLPFRMRAVVKSSGGQTKY